MASVNKVILVGNLGKDPEVRQTPQGSNVATFSIAITEKYNGEEKTEWVNIVLWNKLAEVAQKYLRKGAPVYVEGKLQTTKWDDQNGQTKYKTEVIGFSMQMLGSKSDSAQQGSSPASAPAFSPAPPQDELPF